MTNNIQKYTAYKPSGVEWLCEILEHWEATKIGYEISFNKYFYRHKPLRELEDVTADILTLENESDGLIREILGF